MNSETQTHTPMDIESPTAMTPEQLEQVRRKCGDYWLPAEGTRTRSGRTVKKVVRYAEQEWFSDEEDPEDEVFETDSEDVLEECSEEDSFCANDDSSLEVLSSSEGTFSCDEESAEFTESEYDEQSSFDEESSSASLSSSYESDLSYRTTEEEVDAEESSSASYSYSYSYEEGELPAAPLPEPL